MHTKLHYKWLSKAFDNQNFYLTAGLTAKHIVILTFMLSWCFLGFGQTNGCSDNIGGEISVGLSCNPTNFNSNNDTRYWTSASGCNAASNRDDAWGWFIATSTSTTITYSSTNDAILHLFTGACNAAMTALACSDNIGDGVAETISYATIPGVRYRVRIQRWNSNATMNGQICVYNTPLPPSNDECGGAATLTVNPDNTCTTSTAGTTVAATQSIPAILCNGFTGNADDDVWYSFTATATNHDITVTPGTLNDVVMELRSGSCNGTNIVCADETIESNLEVINASGLTIGETYFVRVYSWGGSGNQGTFNICVTTPDISYCEPITTNPQFVHINDVRFMGSLNDVDNFNSGFEDGFQDFTGLPNAVQAQGEGINVFYNNNSFVGSAFVKAWIDWNQNGSFEDPGELVYDTGGNSTTSATFGFVIPPTTPLGDYRIRIRSGILFQSSGPGAVFLYDFDSCEDFVFLGANLFLLGEAEDYTFTVIENCDARITSVTDNENCGPGTVTLTATSNLPSASFNWYDSETGGTLLASTAGSFTTPALTTTTTYYVTAQNGCETLVRVPVVATINPVSNVTFNPPTLEVCGETNAITINASGDQELVFLVDEDFESGTLGVFESVLGFSNGAPYDTSTQWTNQTSAYVPTNTLVWFPAISSGFGSNQFAMSTSDVNPPDAPGPPGTKRVEQFLQLSAPVNATDVTNLSLTFDMYYSVFGDFVDVQINDGGGWNTVQTFNTSIGIGTRFANQSIDLSAFDNTPNLRIRIRFMSGWGDGVAVDNIKLFGERPVVPSFTWTSTPAVDAFLDPTFTMAYIAGTPAATVYIRPSLAQLELSTFDISANITLSNGCTITESIPITNYSKVWRGDLNGSVNWDNPNNWRPIGVPTEDNCVIIIPGTACLLPNNNIPFPVTDYEGAAKSLNIKNGGTLDIQTLNNLTVTEAINMEATATLNIRNGANIVQIDDVPNTGAGAANMFRNTNIRQLDFVYWSAPVNNFNVTAVSPNTNASRIFNWLPTVAGNGVGGFGQWANTTENMIAGKGYIVRGPNDFTATPQQFTANFSGRLNNGIYTPAISRGTYTGTPYPGAGSTMATALDDNWNLLGNPYPSAINANAFTTLNTNINGTIYLWTHGSEISLANVDPFYGDFGYNYDINDYLAYNITGSNPPGFSGNIGAGQGFFVLMEEVGGTNQTVSFNNAMRVKNQNDLFFRNNETLETGRIWVDLLAPSGHVKTLLVGYVPGASNEQDRLFDAPVLDQPSQTIYSILNDKKFSIEGRALPFSELDVVPIGVLISELGVHTIAINQIDGLFESNQPIFIEDLELGIIHDLNQAPYFFTPENTGNINNRFQLRFTDETLNVNDPNFSNINIFQNENEVTISSPLENIKSVLVYDMLGRLVSKRLKVDSTEFKFNTTNYNNGTYIISTELLNGLVITKKIIF